MPDPDPQAAGLPPATMLQEYRLDSTLGAGGFGVTYLARDAHLEKPVAIKEYFPRDLALRALDGSVVPVNVGTAHDYKRGLERFLSEARTLARFSHPNIARVGRYFEANGTAYMVMEYEKGEPFLQWLDRNRQPEERALKALLRPLLDGLEAVHREGTLHLDITPVNIIIRADGSPVLIDFGAARRESAGMRVGATSIITPGYAPPEHYTRAGRQGPWSDIYGLAAVLFRAVTGGHPPDARARHQADPVGAKLASARVRYGGPFVSAIEWGLELLEARRPQSVEEWRGAILRNKMVRAAADAELPGADAEGAPTRRSRGRDIGVALGIVLFFVFVQSVEFFRERAEERQALSAAQASKSVGSGAKREIEADFHRADADASGELTREEVTAHLPQLAPHFGEIDADRNGRISISELQAYWEKRER